jgi:hypothetical protein
MANGGERTDRRDPKVFGGNRDPAGARAQEILSSIAATCVQRGVAIFNYLSRVVRAIPGPRDAIACHLLGLLGTGQGITGDQGVLQERWRHAFGTIFYHAYRVGLSPAVADLGYGGPALEIASGSEEYYAKPNVSGERCPPRAIRSSTRSS